MKSRKVILRRVTALYVIFFVVIAAGVVRTVSRFSGEDFNTGINDARRMRAASNTDGGRSMELLYEVRLATSNADFCLPVYRNGDDSVTIYARPVVFDLRADSPEGEQVFGSLPKRYGMIAVGVATLAYVAIFVILLVVINSLRRSIRRDDVFRKSNISLTRAIGILLICASLLFSLASWIDARAVAPYFEGGPYAVNTAFQFNFSEIMLGVLIFIIAEVFSISSSLSEEQKLTI